MELKTIYENLCKESSDINEHLPTLKSYGENCEHITEFGSRGGVSTTALLLSNPKRFVSYDIKKHPNLTVLEGIAKNMGVQFECKVTNVLEPSLKIEETDLLFIDTWHKYGQLKEELRQHAVMVKKYIILHDTTTYGYVDEPDWGGLYVDIRPLSTQKIGLWRAVEDFLEENKEWKVLERFENNNGLTILQKN